MKRTLIPLILFLVAGRLMALSWTPSIEAGGAAVLAYNLSIDSEVLDERTSFATEAELRPLSFTLADAHALSLGVRAASVGDSLVWNNTRLMGSWRLALFGEYEVALGKFLLSLDAGLGYGVLKSQDIGFATLEGGIGTGLRFTDNLALRFHFGCVYRREYIEAKIRFGMRVSIGTKMRGGDA